MKTVSVPTDWLNEITGRTVANAIAYLSTLPPDHELTYWQSGGDDHGAVLQSAQPAVELSDADIAHAVLAAEKRS